MFSYLSNNSWFAVNDANSNGYSYIVEYGAPGDSTAPLPPGDLLNGGTGDDWITSSGGNDRIDGGDGKDRLDLNLTMLSQAVILDLSDPTAPAHLSTGGSVVNVEEFTIRSGRGNDEIRTGAKGTLYGGDGNDSLYGGAGFDYLYGDDGDDLINGGMNTDRLEGGKGSDIFSYQDPNEGGDEISNYDGKFDRIQVSAAGFGGGLVAGMDLVASGRYVENSTGLASSASGTGQFIYLDVYNWYGDRLYWDSDGEGGLPATLLTYFSSPVNWSASGLQVV